MQLYRSLIAAPRWPCEKLARARFPDVNVGCPGKGEILFAIEYKIFWGFHSGSIPSNISSLQIHLHPLITYQLKIIHRSPALASSTSYSNTYAEATPAHLDYLLRSLHTLSPSLKDCFLDRITSRKKQRRR